MHEHNECEHNLKHCAKCDVVYCTKCKKEWGGHSCNYWPYYPYYYPTTTAPWITYTVSGSTGITDPSPQTCNHLS